MVKIFAKNTKIVYNAIVHEVNYIQKHNIVQTNLLLLFIFITFFNMNYIKKFAIAALALMMSTSVFAATGDVTSTSSLEVKSAPRLIAKTSNSVTLEWEKVDAATSYIVKFSTKSVANSTEANPQYDNETDPVTTTGTTVSTLSDGKPLQADTEYFFSVVAVDKDNNESDTFSDELQVKTDVAWANTPAPTWDAPVATVTSMPAPAWASSFAIKSANALDNKTLELEFSSALWATPVTVKITKTTDNSEVAVASVANDATNPAKALVKVLTVLDPSSTYSVTVLTASDASGNNIKQWVDGIKEFTTLATLPVSPDSTWLNAWGPATLGSGATMSGATATPNMEAAKTWPKENIIVAIALLISAWLVYGFRRKLVK